MAILYYRDLNQNDWIPLVIPIGGSIGGGTDEVVIWPGPPPTGATEEGTEIWIDTSTDVPREGGTRNAGVTLSPEAVAALSARIVAMEDRIAQLEKRSIRPLGRA